MPRKTKIGLDYFPHSCSLDDELEYIIAVHKEIGYYVYFRLLERIYKNLGYYINWDKKNIALFANNINVDINKVNDIINDCLSEHLFNKSIHKKHNILTSKGIQERYFEAIDRRKEAEIINDYIILKDVYINKLNVDIIWINVDKSTQSKVEYSKVEYSKVEYSKVFNKSRILYLGTKRGNDTEFNDFIKKHKDWKEILPLLLPAVEKQIEYRKNALPDMFVPEWKNFKTWLSQRCWEEDTEALMKEIERKKNRVVL